MARVVFTSHLQRHVRCPETEVDAPTLRAALEKVFRENPRARDYVLDEQGELRKHVVVFIDGQRARDRRELTDPVGKASEIYVLQALTGG
jgi:sulfur-carrier protein